ncbi:MAG TPA: GNAT family protein [Myxococcaceae bacterium]|nr:GNAT family protein [Myxococcaceae bacterium]
MEPIRPVVLEGKHVRLEPLGPHHRPALAAIAARHRETYRLTAVPAEPEGMVDYVESVLAQARAGAALPFATVDRARETVVGSTRFWNLEFWTWAPGHPMQRPPGVPDAVEIGYTWLAPEAQRTALNTEAKLLMLAHAFEKWEVHRVTLKTDVRNARSRAAIERLGARLDGIVRAAVPAADGGIRDTALYSLLAREWPEARDRLRKRLARA